MNLASQSHEKSIHTSTSRNESKGDGAQRQTAPPIRVFLADPHVVIRQVLSDLIELEEDMVECGQAATVEGMFQGLAETNPHVAVLDPFFDEDTDLDLIKELHTQHLHTQLVIFSMEDEQVYAGPAIEVGAAGYVMKSDPTKHLMEAIRSAAQQEVYLSQRVLTLILGKLARGEQGEQGLRFPVDELTEREMEVFRLAGHGKSIAEVASELQLKRSMVGTYQRRIRRKLRLDTLPELYRFATQWVMASRHLS